MYISNNMCNLIVKSASSFPIVKSDIVECLCIKSMCIKSISSPGKVTVGKDMEDLS